jgi:aldose 1-epimerase
MSSFNESNVPVITLAAGDLTVGLAPEIGGCITSFQMRHANGIRNLLRSMSEEAKANRSVEDAAMFVMMPYANRIADNHFEFKGRDYRFGPNVADELFNIHGSGWQSEWIVKLANTVSAEMSLDYLAPDEPYSYSALQRFDLSQDGLTVKIAMTNRGNNTMPFGFGFHPFWDRRDDVTLQFRSTHFWLEGPQSIATDRIATPDELDFSQARLLPKGWRNNCYAGWEGIAEIMFPDSGFGLRIEADPPFRYLMFYSDPNKKYFCLEPQTHVVGAFNRIGRQSDSDLGVFFLEPGQTVEGKISFRHFPI